MAVYMCVVCDTTYDEEAQGLAWSDLPGDWVCPVCESGLSHYRLVRDSSSTPSRRSTPSTVNTSHDSGDARISDAEQYMLDIHQMAETGQSIIEPMGTRLKTVSWDEILIKGAQLAKFPLSHHEPVNTTTIIGPRAEHPLIIETPIYITHMSFGSLSKEAKIALARGSSDARTAMASGEGGILSESLESSYKYIFEYVPNRYSVTSENLKRVDAIEIKIGQSAKPGMGGLLPGLKVTPEIARIRGKSPGMDIISPARFEDITCPEDLEEMVQFLRSESGGRPIGIKLAAGDIEGDLKFALKAGPDFVTIDGRAGGTGAAPKFVKSSASVPTVFALSRARRFLNSVGARDVSLIITGGLRVSSDFFKALALGADAVAIGSSALMALGCKQYRICNTGKCPMGITTQDPLLRSRLDVNQASRRVTNFLNVSTEELREFARMTGANDLHKLSVSDLCSANSEITNHTPIEHV